MMMKARVKATGEIVDVIAISDYINEYGPTSGQIIGVYKDANGILYNSYDLDFYIEEGITIPDYWTRLEHQYAGMAMQGLIGQCADMSCSSMAGIAIGYAHALVEKLKSKNNG